MAVGDSRSACSARRRKRELRAISVTCARSRPWPRAGRDSRLACAGLIGLWRAGVPVDADPAGRRRTSPWPSRLVSGSLIGRARLPLTSQVDAVAGSASSARRAGSASRACDATRSRVSRSSRSGIPATARRATVCEPARETARTGRLSRPAARCGRSPRTARDQRSEDRPRADLDEHPRSVPVHRLDHLAEPHGAGEMVAQPAAIAGGARRVGRRVQVRVHRAGRASRRSRRCGELLERLARRGDHRGVEGASRPARAGRRSLGRGQVERLAARLGSGPAITVCLGPFQLAACTPGTSRIRRSTSSGPARRAAIAPVWPAPASCIKRPRSLESSASAAAPKTPAACSATSSP